MRLVLIPVGHCLVPLNADGPPPPWWFPGFVAGVLLILFAGIIVMMIQ